MPWNILHVRRGVRCSSCDRIFISCHSKYSFIHRKSVLWHKMFFFIPVTGNKFPVTRNIVYFTGKDPSVTDTPFVTVSFLVTCVYILSCDRKCSFYYKKYSFLVKFGSSYSCIPFSQQMCGIYNQNFLWDIRISWEPGSLVPRDYPTLVCQPYMYRARSVLDIWEGFENDRRHLKKKNIFSSKGPPLGFWEFVR